MCGQFPLAQRALDEMKISERDFVSWTLMIVVYVHLDPVMILVLFNRK